MHKIMFKVGYVYAAVLGGWTGAMLFMVAEPWFAARGHGAVR